MVDLLAERERGVRKKYGKQMDTWETDLRADLEKELFRAYRKGKVSGKNFTEMMEAVGNRVNTVRMASRYGIPDQVKVRDQRR